MGVLNMNWVKIKGYEDFYEISSSGEIRSKDRTVTDKIGRTRSWKGKVLNPNIAPNGYYRVSFSINRKRKQFYVHRLIAEYFIPNPDNLPQVNHIDGNKLNNSLDNLEWVTVQDNVIHAYKNGLINHISGKEHFNYGKFGSESKKAKPVIATNVITNETKRYGSLIETKQDGFTPSEVSRACNHGGTHKGHLFEFANMI